MSLDTGNTTISAGTGIVNIRQKTTGIPINLGEEDATGVQLGLFDSELDRVTAGTVNIGDANTSNIFVTGVITQTGHPTNLITSGSTTVFNVGALLGIYGTVSSPVEINLSTTIAPGTSPGVINCGNLSFSVTRLTPSKSAGPPRATQRRTTTSSMSPVPCRLTGTLTLTSFGGFVPSAGQTFVIIANDSTDAVSGEFDGYPEGFVITNFLGAASINGTITYAYPGGTGNDVAIITGAEPTPTPTPTPTETPTPTPRQLRLRRRRLHQLRLQRRPQPARRRQRTWSTGTRAMVTPATSSEACTARPEVIQPLPQARSTRRSPLMETVTT